MQRSGIITLTTDFGLRDSYVGVMKGVMLGVNPRARLIDITHAINPQDIAQAAHVIEGSAQFFPVGTVHLVVVDPGVGSTRRAIGLETPEGLFIAPDNGVLTLIWQQGLERFGKQQLQLVELAEPRFWRNQISNTFHGRDIFAPVAAHLTSGLALQELGPLLDEPVLAAFNKPYRNEDGTLSGQIIYIDHFGNCMTNLSEALVELAGLDERAVVYVNGRSVGLVRTYADVPVGSFLALFGSNGHLELAIRNGHAAQRLGVTVGDVVRVFANREAAASS